MNFKKNITEQYAVQAYRIQDRSGTYFLTFGGLGFFFIFINAQ